ncbi:hypothetical protein EZV77_11165 [Burkholderia thailandensis]|nr:hypothetical protein AQ476_15675 [Burkholderia thailandensis]MDD1482075.1 hypothetical protein [Burkholderia thailandensis]MDD1488502.1 hypothetical protein [Burkholderia thailandensis]MDD1492415.1 hypothetical protein [Burkholderia thailandensis]PJO70486.1 hypothetical protein CWD92_20830 [Burkholderia thailandensis]
MWFRIIRRVVATLARRPSVEGGTRRDGRMHSRGERRTPPVPPAPSNKRFSRQSDACAGRDPYRFVTARSSRRAAFAAPGAPKRPARGKRRRRGARARDRLLHDTARATRGLY